VGAFPIGGERAAGRGSRRRGEGRDTRRRGGRGEGRDGEARQQPRPHEAAVPRAALRVQDLELRAATRRPVAIALDAGHAPLAHHVPAEPDPARPAEIQSQTARLLDRRRQPAAEPVRLQDQQQRPGPARQRREAVQPVPHLRPHDGRVPPVRQVQHQQVHRPRGEQRARQRERLLQVRRREHHQPLRDDPAGDGLHGIEGAREVQPGDDRPRDLCLRRDPERERRLARRGVSAQRHRGRARQPARAEDRVQRGEPRRHHAAVRVRGGDPWPGRRHERDERRRAERDDPGSPFRLLLRRQRGDGERALDRGCGLSPAAWSGHAPACLERGEGLGDVGCASHRTSNNRTNVLLVKGWRSPETASAAPATCIGSSDSPRRSTARTTDQAGGHRRSLSAGRPGNRAVACYTSRPVHPICSGAAPVGM
jgi:hypothetical protein